MKRTHLFWAVFVILNFIPFVASGACPVGQWAKGPDNSCITIVCKPGLHLVGSKCLKPKVKADEKADAKPEAKPAPVEQKAEAPTVAQSAIEDLTLAQLKATFIKFDIKRDGASERIALFGITFKDCRDKFQFSSSANDPKIQTPGLAGLRVRDLGGGRTCMEKHKAKNDTCGPNGDACMRLVNIDEAKLDFSDLPHAKIGLLRVDFMLDSDTPALEELDPAIEHKSKAEVAQDRRDALVAAREARIARLRNQVNRCRRTSDELMIAQSALEQLERLRALAEGEKDKMARALEDSALTLFSKRAANGSSDDLGSLREDVASWAADHAARADAVARVYYDIARRYVAANQQGTEGYDQASATIGEGIVRLKEALASGDIEAADKAKFEMARTRMLGYQKDLAVDRLGALANKGLSNNYLFWPAYADLVNRTQTDAMNACNGQGATLEGCANAMNLANTVARMPAAAQQVDQKNFATWQKIQQTMMQAQGGVQQNGMPMNAGMPMQTGAPMWAGGNYGAGNNGPLFK